jgi:serine/threonine protein kinase
MTESLEDRIREELAPDLEIRRSLGRGSMATVFLAREPALKRMVAVKVLRPEVASADNARRRFEREAQAAARLNHPSLTDIYRVGRLRLGVPYIVMEYIDGRNLADAIKARGPLTVDEVRDVIRSVAEALDAAHSKGIIHRDVRPANVIREDATGRVVLTDFGIAALLESGSDNSTQLTTMGHRIGNPHYMSPEHLNGEPLTVQSDIYSLGVLGYELLTGQGPFPGTGAAAIVQQVHGQPRRIADLRPDVDAQLAQVLEQCLAKNPEHRPRAADIAMVLSSRDGMLDMRPREGRSPMLLFLDELKRRSVYKVGAAYILFASLVFSFLDVAGNDFDTIARMSRGIVITLAAAFPIVLVLAWVFDVREGRVVRTIEPAPASIESATKRRIIIAISFGTILLVTALIVIWWLR